MEREALLCVLSAASFGVVVWTLGALADKLSSHRATSERRAWWALASPVLGALGGIAFLVGWALQEPDPADEWAGAVPWLVASWVAVTALRALWRACAALQSGGVDHVTVAAVGILRPRVVVAPHYAGVADRDVLDAALAHERAHCRGHDPLRIWLAQLLADLQWPLPGAGRRLQTWLVALEMRRDDEAIVAGAKPLALAEAILLAARMGTGSRAYRSAQAAGSGAGLRWRVQRLLATAAPHQVARAGGTPWIFAVGYVVGLAVSLWAGLAYGESILRGLPGVGS